MTVRIAFARVSICAQYDDYSEDIHQFSRVEVGIIGFTGGARFRVKNFNSVTRAQSYLNKLHAGGWMTDSDYDTAFSALERLSHTGWYPGSAAPKCFLSESEVVLAHDVVVG